jgi:hypothetical protein
MYKNLKIDNGISKALTNCPVIISETNDTVKLYINFLRTIRTGNEWVISGLLTFLQCCVDPDPGSA